MRLSELNMPRSELEHLISEYVYIARNKTIFFKKLEGATYEEIAEEYHLSTQQTKSIVKDCINRISKHI